MKSGDKSSLDGATPRSEDGTTSMSHEIRYWRREEGVVEWCLEGLFTIWEE